jgi:hypothetical protein
VVDVKLEVEEETAEGICKKPVKCVRIPDTTQVLISEREILYNE